MRVGLISDTHGMLRPQALAFLRGCDHIVHAGDIGGMAILRQLEQLAPLTAVRGNNDAEASYPAVPETTLIELGRVRLYLLHDLKQLAIDPVQHAVQVVVSGHSHKPRVHRDETALYINPGSAGPRRFTLPVSVGELHIDGDQLTARLVELQV